MDKELLIRLFQTPAISSNEKDMVDVVCDELDRINIEYSVDKMGNIYNLSKPNRPLLSAHLDTVQGDNDAKMAAFVRIKEGYIKGNGVIGGDDKCGVYAILQTLNNGDEVNFVFSVQEEIGGYGASYFTLMNDLSDIPYGLILDRRGSSDVICTQNEYGVKEFEDALLEVGKEFGFEKAMGTWSDADVYSEYMSCANISVGYYNAHTKDEFVILEELQNTIDFIHYVVTGITETFRIPTKKHNYNSSGILNDKTCDICGYNDEPVYELQSVMSFMVCDRCLRELQTEVDGLLSNDRYYTDNLHDEYFGDYYG